MKFTLALQPGRMMTHADAVGCLTANLALPGSGSLAAGKAVGYIQLALTLAGFILSMAGALACLRWYLKGGFDPAGDPVEQLSLFWQHVKWPLLGIAIFVGALVWALATSLRILAEHPKVTAKDKT